MFVVHEVGQKLPVALAVTLPTDIEVTKDSIIFLEYLGAPDNRIQRQARPIEECIEFIEGNNEEGEPFEITLCEGDDKVTYVMFDLQNRYE